MIQLIDRLEQEHILSKDEFTALINGRDEQLSAYLFEKSAAVAKAHFGNRIYTRGLIELSNYCKNDCYYCGIRKSNCHVDRYRLTQEEILSCCRSGYALGYRTFVLQGGEDGYFTDERLIPIVSAIRQGYPDCAITLSLGERSTESYARLKEAGANRYLLRHETANEAHYQTLHPASLSGANRKACLYALKELGYQVGSGFMVGSPGQTPALLAEDLLFLWKLQPQMIGIGPFVHQKDTPFAQEPSGTLDETLFLIGILRLMLPNVLLPSTTALGTIDPQGREKGILAGANVVMPNLSPVEVREKYSLYDNKICTGEEAAEYRTGLQKRMEKIGYTLSDSRGDYCPE